MEQNKTGKYLKYAIGEIVLVVIGILIALSINNWNEQRKQGILEEDFIAGIKNDLKQDKNYIDLIINLSEDKLKVFDVLNHDLPRLYTDDKNKLDSLIQIIFVANRTFYPISGSFQSAISENGINKFKNKKVISKIVKLYNSKYSRIIDNGKMLDYRYDFIIKKYTHVRRIGNIGEMTLSETSVLIDDLFYYYKQLNFYIDLLKNTLIEINTLVQET